MNAAIMAALTMATMTMPPKVEVIAHRGESADAPENTLAAFRLAWQRNADAIELDVHLSRHGRPVVIHDPDLKRVAGDPRKVAELTWDELRRFDVGSWKDPRWAGERVPSLDGVLATIPPGKRCLIEIKGGPEHVGPVAAAVRASGKKPTQLAIISFKAPTVAAAKQQLPEVPAYLVAKFKQDDQTKAWSPTLDDLIRDARRIGADGLDLSADGPLDAAAVQAIRRAGLKLLVWTVDEPATARKFADWGVDGITTNAAGRLRRELNGGRPMSETEKIEALIRHVEGLDGAKFIRNGTAYDATTAVRFLRGKWDNEKAHIKTASDFIERVATKSSTTGRPYLIRLQDGTEKPCGDYLAGQLARIDAKPR
jgi:glycerophosphoryl diester phosphodiesterase